MTALFESTSELPFLERDQERDLLRAWQVDGDESALEKLVFSHNRLVKSWAARFCKDPQIREDLVTEGYMGLVKAANEFDLERTVRFSTYARWWVRNHVARANAEMTSFFGVAATRQANPDRIVAQVSFDNELLENLQSTDLDPEEQLIHTTSTNRLREKIAEALLALDTVERDVVIARHLKNPPESIDALAARFSMPSERVRLVERKSLSQLKFRLLQMGVATHREQ